MMHMRRITLRLRPEHKTYLESASRKHAAPRSDGQLLSASQILRQAVWDLLRQNLDSERLGFLLGRESTFSVHGGGSTRRSHKFSTLRWTTFTALLDCDHVERLRVPGHQI